MRQSHRIRHDEKNMTQHCASNPTIQFIASVSSYSYWKTIETGFRYKDLDMYELIYCGQRHQVDIPKHQYYLHTSIYGRLITRSSSNIAFFMQLCICIHGHERQISYFIRG
eukprot:GHVO01024186.1.p1 GENE.GHVO01024186.1~~GHVO01024186.1.p1  ORF type:complete len:111 (-),score=2.74 GHVO01024186.1:403-735(-)